MAAAALPVRGAVLVAIDVQPGFAFPGSPTHALIGPCASFVAEWRAAGGDVIATFRERTRRPVPVEVRVDADGR